VRVLLILAALWGCTSTDRNAAPLVDQILTPLPESKTLNYRYCSKESPLGSCQEYKVEEHEATESFANELLALRFVCKDAIKIYTPCFQKEFGLCYSTTSGWGPWKKNVQVFTAFNANINVFINSRLKCFSINRYSIEGK
jgi:hypothetical protein